MTPDTIAIEIHGSITNGLWSPERGESRWAQNVAAVLGAAGYPVVGFGSWTPGENPWGCCPRVPNVELLPWPALRDADFRVLFDAARWMGKPELGRPRTLLRGYFSYQQEVIDGDWPAHHRLVHPYPHCLLPTQTRRPSALLQLPVLPLAWWEKFGAGPFGWPERRGLLFGTKPVASIGNTQAAWERIALEAAAAAGEPVAVVQGPQYIPEHRELMADADVFGTIPLGAVLGLMRRSTLCLDLPISGLFPLECVMEGCLPMAWRGAYIPTICEAAERIEPSIVLDASRPDATAFRSIMDRLLSDDHLRARLLDAYWTALAPFSPEAALASWMEVERWIDL